MATLSYVNLRKDSICIHATANATVVIAGNNTVSNIATTSQVLTGASISRMWFGMAAGHCNVKRGSNLVFTVSGSGYQYYDGQLVGIDKTANVVIEFVGTGANAHIMIELKKEGQGTGTP